jgi:hypothetical protein
MAKIVKKKRKLKIHNLVNLVLGISLCLYFGGTFFLKAYNITLNKQLTNLRLQNEEDQKELQTLRLEVAKYTERDYLMSVCAQYGVDLSFDSDRITYITVEE